MLDRLSVRRRALVSSAAYTMLVALVTALGYLTFRAVSERRQPSDAPADTETVPLVEFDNFSSRLERSSDSERISISLRLRLTAPSQIETQVYIVARNDRVAPKLWGVWPTQGPEGAITSGGHFRDGNAKTGEPIPLTSSWMRITGAIAHPLGAPPYETVTVYVIGPNGDVLLARPFALP